MAALGGRRPALLAAVVGLALLAAAPRPCVARPPSAGPPARNADPGEADDVLDLLYLAGAGRTCSACT